MQNVCVPHVEKAGLSSKAVIVRELNDCTGWQDPLITGVRNMSSALHLDSIHRA